MPLFFAILQLALVWHVKTTLTSAASQGARYGAAYDRDLEDGERRTSAVIDAAFGDGSSTTSGAAESRVGGQPVVEVDVQAQVPMLGFWGPTITVEGSGHAVKEILP